MPRAGVQTSGHYHQLELRPSSIRPLRPRRHITARCCCRCRKRKKKEPKKKESGLMETDATVEKQKTLFPPLLAKPFGFCTVSTGQATMDIKQQNRTLHLLQKPDIFICYRQEWRTSKTWPVAGTKPV